MSAIANLYNVPSTQNELDNWAFAHMAHHRDINRRIFELTQVRLPEYVLDPVNPRDPYVWLYQHQQLHNEMDALLGISGNDLLDVDFSDRDELAGWIWLNSSEHFQASNILEIG